MASAYLQTGTRFIATMKQYITEKDGFEGPIIEACDFAHAEQQAESLGVTVSGELRLTIVSDSMTPERADALVKALAEQENTEE